MDTPNPKYLEERSRVLVGNLPDDFLRFGGDNTHSGSVTNGHSQPDQRIQQQHFASQQQQQHMASQQQQHMASQPMVNQITITVVQAELTKNYSLTKMDPYVRVRIGHSVYETHTSIRAGKFPRWNKIITSYLDPGIKTVHFEIFDECTLTPDERIAYADVVIPEEIFKGKVFDESIPLSGKQGPEKEGFLNVTMNIRSVPYWSTVAAPTLMVTPQLPYYTPHYAPGIVPYNQSLQYQRPAVGSYIYPSVQPQPYRPSEEDIKQIQEMFPSYDREVIISVLENCYGNKDQAITQLLSLSDK